MNGKLYRLVVILLLAGLIAAAGWFGWPWYAQRAEHTSLEMVTRRGHEVTSVEVIKLGEKASDPSGPSYHAGCVGWNFPITGRQTLTGAEAVKLVDLWKHIQLTNGYQTLCHEPGFVLRFMVGTKCIFEASVCFKCENICWNPTPFTSACISMVSPRISDDSKMDDLKNYLMKL